MKFKKGQKVRLDLHTKMGNHGISEDAHNNIGVVTSVFSSFYFIRDRQYVWSVYPGMLKPLENEQLLFDFIYED